MPTPAVPFSLALPKESNIDRGRIQSKVFQVRGVARWEADRLTLEWSGSIDITDIEGGSVRNLRQSVPAQRLVLPPDRIASIETRGRWWRPYIELRTTGIGPLDLVPTASGLVSCRPRGERLAAVAPGNVAPAHQTANRWWST